MTTRQETPPPPAMTPPPRGIGFIMLMILVGVLAPTTFLGLPEIIGQVARQHGFAESQLGLLAFAEIIGMTCGTLLVAFVLARQPVRATLAAAVLLAATGHAAGALCQDFHTLVLVRALAGIGYGAMSGISMRYLAFSDHPERSIGLMVMGQGVWSLLLLSGLLPVAGRIGGASGCYLVSAAFMLPGLIALLWLRAGETLVAPAGTAADAASAPAEALTRHGPALLTLGALLMLYMGVGVMWTFVERVGAEAGLSPAFISTTLGLANAGSVVACWFAPRLATRRWLYVGTLTVLGLCGLAAAVLAKDHTAWAYASAVTVFLTAWAVAAVLLFSTVPQFDGVGRYAAVSPGFLGLGFGVGSLLGGELMEHASTSVALGVASAACFAAVALYAMLPLRARSAVPQPVL